ncbi:type IX secretion system lipoprotein PorK/GldK [Segetibacter aerophilus]|uniref:Gliding motility lipoprotein GldK n=1 Tax=Segetibacter aerophilus TaxID=670293 RepID=A0A512BFE1_9BACT|nr:SUMF1/EgtB/PvdO family nonheme iron enzyme [Segetibacter aerophilus]GEO10673.1 gliding motility lipoprotein GldK [Segetibacter aerophilus]
MRSQLFAFAALTTLAVGSIGCGNKGKSKGMLDNGQLMGASYGNIKSMGKPIGMVYVPPGTFHMGPSDEDVNFNFTARNKQVSINGFWMDATEITNNEYRQFVWWVRDSLTAKELGYGKEVDGSFAVDWKKVPTIKYSDKATLEKISKLTLTPDNRLYGRNEIDPEKLLFRVESFNMKEAAKLENKGKPRNSFVVKYDEKVYPDTLVWMRDFSYSYNEPMAKRYFAHPSFGNYPVVGVNWKQAVAFSKWRTNYMNSYLERKKMAVESDFRLPTEAEWEYAARGGRTQSPYPWGGPYLRNKKGCLLANFKPGRGNYAEDGGFYTVRADAYWPNDYGLYNMSGNVAEWTTSLYYEGSYNFQHDMNPDIRWDAKDTDPPRMKRKVLRGGSWKDVGYFLQTGTRSYEYQDTSKSYIGFRCVIDLPASNSKRR